MSIVHHDTTEEYVDSIARNWPDGVPKPSMDFLMEDSVRNEVEMILMELGFIGAGSDDWDDEDREHYAAMASCLSKTIKRFEAAGKSKTLVHDPAKRVQMGKDNLKKVLDWLRHEPYSNVEIMSLVLGKTVVGTRGILNKFVKQGWLIRDEIDWVGSSRKVHIFGASSVGLFHMMDEDDIEPAASRDFKRNRVVASTARHVLNIQLARLYYQRIGNPKKEFRLYRAARDLPCFQSNNSDDRLKKWMTYPDCVISNSHLSVEGDYPMSIAVEIEQSHKGSKRYKALVKAHVFNMKTRDQDNLPRYDRVIYMLEDESKQKSFQRMFHKIIEQQYVHREVVDQIKEQFLFDTYDGLADRIRKLGLSQ